MGGLASPIIYDRVPIFPPPMPLPITLKPAQGKLCPLGARGLAVNSLFRDVAHLFQNFRQVPEPLFKVFDFHLQVLQLLIKKLDAVALVRALGLKQCLHASEGLGESHDSLKWLRVFFGHSSIWDHSSIWRAFFL